MLQKIYDLRGEHDRIEGILKAASGSGPFGLILSEGALTDENWWQTLECCTVDGSIEDFDYGPMGDWPTFRIRTNSGTVTDWITRDLGRGHPDLYRIGVRVRWRYINVSPRMRLAGLPETHPLTLEIWIDDEKDHETN